MEKEKTKKKKEKKQWPAKIKKKVTRDSLQQF